MKRRSVLLAIAVAAFASATLFARFGISLTADAAANVIYVDQACQTDGSDTIYFSWQGNDPAALQTWLDVGSSVDWKLGTYIGAGPFKPSVNTFTWPGFSTGKTFYVRLNQQLAGGAWDPSQTFRFVTSCSPDATPPPAGTQVAVTVTASPTATPTSTPAACPQMSGTPPFGGTPPAGISGAPGSFPGGAPPSGAPPSGNRPAFNGTPPAGCAPGGAPPR